MHSAHAILLFAMVAVGCRSKSDEAANVPLGQAPPQASVSPSGGELTGRVAEHLNAPPYIYLRLQTDKGSVWAAVPEAKVEDGSQVTVLGPMLMTKFSSKTLNRTFDQIYFGTLTPPSTAGMAAGSAADPHGGVVAAMPTVTVGKVEKANGPTARTVAEVWAQKARLVGSTVTIRGMVVKYNDNIMGRNWIHLQDGSGDAKQGTHDITVTTRDAATRGQIVTVTGTVQANKDFGAGYAYPIIVENATIEKKSD
jgi:hypothetical protein